MVSVQMVQVNIIEGKVQHYWYVTRQDVEDAHFTRLPLCLLHLVLVALTFHTRRPLSLIYIKLSDVSYNNILNPFDDEVIMWI